MAVGGERMFAPWKVGECDVKSHDPWPSPRSLRLGKSYISERWSAEVLKLKMKSPPGVFGGSLWALECWAVGVSPNRCSAYVKSRLWSASAKYYYKSTPNDYMCLSYQKSAQLAQLPDDYILRLFVNLYPLSNTCDSQAPSPIKPWCPPLWNNVCVSIDSLSTGEPSK